MSKPPVAPTTVPTAQQLAVTGPVPPTLTITQYKQMADAILGELSNIAGLMPQLEKQVATRKFVRSHLNARIEFLETAVAAVEMMPQLQVLNKLDVPSAQDALQFITAFRPVLDQVLALAQALKFTLDSKRAALTTDAQNIYRISVAMAQDGGSGALSAHVAAMKRERRRRRPVPEEQEVPTTEKLAA
ncbi:MAG TPA: hypothetical protein VGF69_23220 [Thermoanaerobaculia bacterium]|jgi:hypothetical protein